MSSRYHRTTHAKAGTAQAGTVQAPRRRRHASVRHAIANTLLTAALCTTVIACGGAADDKTVRVVVPAGASLRSAADSLERAGVINSSRLFRWYAAIGGRDRSIQAGTYALQPGQPWKDVLQALTDGSGVMLSVTIPEGFDLRKITPRLAQQLQVPEDSVRAAVRDSAWRAERGVTAQTLEGYLFPDTYSFAAGTTAREAVATLLQRFDAVWQPAWDARAQALGLTRHDVVTMASLVEKEARVGEERPTIAAVYWNRVKLGMLLQADPTVQYALPAHVDRVLFVHLEVESPYNTYRYPGLPPGPIASPGAASIEASLFPDSVSYLYFVAHPDGHHEFRNTFAEHQQAIQMVRREARRRNSSRDDARENSGNEVGANAQPLP